MGEQKTFKAREKSSMEMRLYRKKLVGEPSSPAPLTPRPRQRGKASLPQLVLENFMYGIIMRGTPSLSNSPWSQEGDILTLENGVTF
jgi:hypothetical protein